MSDRPPAGWYVREGETEEHWWDGNSWADTPQPPPAPPQDSPPQESPPQKDSRLSNGEVFGVVMIVIVALGGLIALNVAWFFNSYADGPNGFRSTNGTIVEYVPHDESANCAPRIEYQVDGVPYSVTGKIYSDCFRPVDVERGVFYNPLNPADAVVDRPISSRIANGFAALGVVCLVSAAVVAWVLRRNRLQGR